jgi:hypothetical protein
MAAPFAFSAENCGKVLVGRFAKHPYWTTYAPLLLSPAKQTCNANMDRIEQTVGDGYHDQGQQGAGE